MKFRLVETIGLHWGDLDKGIKAEQRRIGLHGTGHFGTGFYLVNKDNYVDDQGRLKKDYDERRPIYEIDIDLYNLFKPKNNSDAHELHDALKDINKFYDEDTIGLLGKDVDKGIDGEKEGWSELTSKLYDSIYSNNKSIDNIDWDDFDLDNFDLDDLLDIPDEYFTYNGDKPKTESEQEQDDRFKKEFNQLGRKFAKDHNLLDWVNFYYNSWDENTGRVDSEINNAIEKKWYSMSYLNYSIGFIADLFGIGKKDVIDLLVKIDTSKEDTNSTQLIKLLGYDGIDVTHLGKDADGYSDLDNFTYGTVIYDLKPGTYKKVSDPSGEKRVGKKI